MPTQKPRLTVTFDPAFYATLSRLAELQHRSRSSVLNDLLVSVHEPLQRTVELLEMAVQAPVEVKKGLRSTVERLERDLVAHAGIASGDLDEALQEARRLVTDK